MLKDVEAHLQREKKNSSGKTKKTTDASHSSRGTKGKKTSQTNGKLKLHE